MKSRWIIPFAVAALALSACGSSSNDAGATGGASEQETTFGYSIRTLDDPFQALEATAVTKAAEAAGITMLPVVNANGDAAKQNQDVNNLLTRGISGLLVNPIDPDAIVPAIEKANSMGVPVVTVDSTSNGGDVVMDVTADNAQAGAQACEVMGDRLGGTGTVLNLQGSLNNDVGIARSDGFTECISEKFPGIEVISKPMNWSAQECAQVAQTVLSTSQVDGIYTAASIICTDPVNNVLQQLGRSTPTGDPSHVVHVSIDGSPGGLAAVRGGTLDAIISQPLDQFATYAVYWLQRAVKGETAQAGPTDHNSTVVEINGHLVDQLPVTTVTTENVDDPSLWGNQPSAG